MIADTTPPRLLYPKDEAREILGGIGTTKLHEVINAGELELVHIGRRSFVPADSLAAYVERLRAQEVTDDDPAD